MERQEIKRYWKQVAFFFLLQKTESEVLLSFILKTYNNERRTYHNLKHILDILRHADTLQLKEKARMTLFLAAFYHDLAYDPKRKDNELQSIKLLEKHFKNVQINQEVVQHVKSIILQTENHKGKDDLSQLFQDLDMTILGSPTIRYQEYTLQIRAEYHEFNDVIFALGRKQFILKTLNAPSIFQSPKFIERYETKAIQNLKNELKTLEL